MYRYRNILLFAVACLIAACSSDGTLEKEPVVTDESYPMVFGSLSASSAATTRSSSSLELLHDNFKVSVWKNYGNENLQNVMDGYRVNYKAATGTTAAQWDYGQKCKHLGVAVNTEA